MRADSVLHARLGTPGACLACSLGVTDAPCVCGITVLWRAVRQVAIPQWAGAEDACTVHERIELATGGRGGALGGRRRRGAGRKARAVR